MLYTDVLQALKGERLSSVFSSDGTLISASAAPHCGGVLHVLLSHWPMSQRQKCFISLVLHGLLSHWPMLQRQKCFISYGPSWSALTLTYVTETKVFQFLWPFMFCSHADLCYRDKSVSFPMVLHVLLSHWPMLQRQKCFISLVLHDLLSCWPQSQDSCLLFCYGEFCVTADMWLFPSQKDYEGGFDESFPICALFSLCSFLSGNQFTDGSLELHRGNLFSGSDAQSVLLCNLIKSNSEQY